MSQKNRRRPQIRRQPRTLPAGTGKTFSRMKQGAVLSALDGFTNKTAFLGEDSPLFASGTFVRSGLSMQPEKLTTAYRENWLAKRIIDMPTEDMTRSWYTLSTSMPEADLQALRELEAKHSVKQEIANAIRWARLYGGSIAVMVLWGEENRLDEPLDMDRLLPGCFQGLLVLDRTQGITPSEEKVTDLDSPDFGLPKYYEADVDMGEVRHVKIHHSRVLRFIGRELPYMETLAENYWGASELEHVWEEILKISSTSANIAQLVFQANVTTLKMGDFGDHMAFGSDETRNAILRAIAQENRIRTSFGLQVLSADDALEQHSYSFGGLAEILETFMMHNAGAAEIPATKLFGRSPQGMNATGEADLRNYYDMILQMQERHLRPALEKLLPVMAVSCWGFVPGDMEIFFRPMMTGSPAERTEMIQKLTADVVTAYRAGLVTREEAREELLARGDGLGYWGKIQE